MKLHPSRIAVFLVALAAALPASSQRAPEGASGWSDKPAVHARRFIAATANPHATDAAYAMLARGGSAVDAAIAAQWVLGLVEPQSSGLGGGAFLLVHDPRDGKLRAYDGRETAPAAATPARFLKSDGSTTGFDDVVATGLSVGVPGLMRLAELAHERHGRLPWATLFESAIALAERGFAVSPRLAAAIAADRHLAGSGRAAAYFLDGAGKPLAAGTRGLVAKRRHQCFVSAAAISLSVSCVARSTSDTPVRPAAALANPSRRID